MLYDFSHKEIIPTRKYNHSFVIGLPRYKGMHDAGITGYIR